MNWLILVLSVLTAVYLGFSFVQDLKERKIYSFPCLILIDAWAIVLWKVAAYSRWQVIVFLLVHSTVYVLMRAFKLWGEGDCDLFLLFGNICLVMLPEGTMWGLAMQECLLLAVSVGLSLGIGAIEYRIKKRTFSLKGDMAVVPGFSVVLIGLMAWGVIGRFIG